MIKLYLPILKPYKSDNYTLILQSTVTKRCYSFNNQASMLGPYYIFDIDEIPTGEYRYILVPNPDKYDVNYYYNNIWKSTLTEYTILTAKDNILTALDNILCIGFKSLDLNVISSGLVVIGNYLSDKLSYNYDNFYN